MAVTLTHIHTRKIFGRRHNTYDVAFDASYPTGGESLTAAQVGLRVIEDIKCENAGGYMFRYDRTNSKLIVYTPVGALAAHTHAVALDTGASAAEAAHTHAVALDGGESAAEAAHTHAVALDTGESGAEAAHTHAVALDTGASAAGDAHTHAFTGTAQAPVLVVEEVQAVASNTCTLSHVPLYIVAVDVTAGNVTGAFNVIPTGETPLTLQVAVTFPTGVLTFLSTDAVTSVRVTYLPKRGSGYLSAVTVDEAVVAAAAKTNLAARAGLVQYVWNDTSGVLCALEPSGEAPSAANTAVVDINDSSNTSIDSNAADEGNSLKVTYVPFAQLAPGTFVDDTDITLSAEVWNFTGDPTVLGYHNLVVPGLGTILVGERGDASNAAPTWAGPSGTAANTVATWNPARNSIITNLDVAMVTTAISWMVLDPLQLTPETPAGSNANESTHTHGPGTLADAASGAGSSHVHGPGTLADAASGAGSSHVHGPGTLADAASGAGSSHTHGPGTLADAASGTGGAIVAAAAAEVANETNLSTVTCRIVAVGL